MRIHKILTSLFVLASSMLVSVAAFAEEAAVVSGITIGDDGIRYMAAALAIGLAATAGCYSQARAASAALEGIARNPQAAGKVFVPMLLGLALIESLVIYALIIAFMLVG
jgi:F-type H+-transporting ATPase subunit c